MTAQAASAPAKKLPTKRQLAVLAFVRDGRPYEGAGEGVSGARGARTTLLEGMRRDGYIVERRTGHGIAWVWALTEDGELAYAAGETR